MKISIFVKIFENLDLSNFCLNLDFSKKNYKNLDSRRNFRTFRKISILVKIVDFVNILKNSSFWSRFLKNLDFDQNYRNISIFI